MNGIALSDSMVNLMATPAIYRSILTRHNVQIALIQDFLNAPCSSFIILLIQCHSNYDKWRFARHILTLTPD